MQDAQYQTATRYYHELIDSLSDRFPRFIEESVKLAFVAHAFEDKLPLIDTLAKRQLLASITLKKSSSQAQPKISKAIAQIANESNVPCTLSSTTYAKKLNIVPYKGKIHIANHGGYSLTSSVPSNVIGMTEHTLNGEKRLEQIFRTHNAIPYKSTACIDLKERSDRETAYSIANQIIRDNQKIGKSMASHNSNEVMLLIGYGTMGRHIAQKLQQLNCQAKIIIDDISNKKKVFAIQDGFIVSKNLNKILPEATSISLSTDRIEGDEPVFTPEQFALLREDVSIFSTTSADDELQQNQFIKLGIIVKQAVDGNHGIYIGPTGKRFFLMNDGKPANVFMPDGGVKEAMMLVEGAGLAGAFELTQNPKNNSATLSEEAKELVASPWLRHYTQPTTQYPAFTAS